MKKSFRYIILFFISVTIQKTVFAQVDSSSNICEIFIGFFQSKETKAFMQSKNDSATIIYDADQILSKCNIRTWGDKQITIINSGENIVKIQKDGIFTTINDKRNFLIVKKNKIKTLTIYRVFNPKTGADTHIVTIKKRGQYFVKKRSSGWF